EKIGHPGCASRWVWYMLQPSLGCRLSVTGGSDMAFRLVSRLLVGCVIAGSATGCSDDAAEEGNGSATCDITISPGADDTKALQTAFVEATSGNTICLSPGNYTINELVTVGATPG